MPSPCSAALRGPETLCEIAADPDRAAALHGVVGDFCHLLRNRLNSLQITLYLARREDARGEPATWDDLDRQYRAVEGVVELFQSVCRPMPLTPVTIGLGLVLHEFEARWSPKFAGRGLTFASSLDGADGLSRLDPSRLAHSLDALAGWRLEGAKTGTRVRLRGHVEQGRSLVEWSESGAAPTDRDGELALASLARVASAHGGGMTRDDSEGWRVRIEWPSVVTSNAFTP